MTSSVIDIIEEMRMAPDPSDIRHGMRDIETVVDIVVDKLKYALEAPPDAAARCITQSLALLMSDTKFRDWLMKSEDSESEDSE